MSESPFSFLFHRLRRSWPGNAQNLSLELNEEVMDRLENIAKHELRPIEDVAADLLLFALDHRRISDEVLRCWESLSEREQEVGALLCLGLTNREIGKRLTISSETVKTHVRNLLAKFGVSSRLDIRVLLADWDFSEWYKKFS